MLSSVCGFSLQPTRFAVFLAWFTVTGHDIVGVIQVWESAYRQRPHGVIKIKGMKNTFFKKNLFFVRFEDGRSFWRLRVWKFSQVVWIFEEKVFFARFCIDSAALQSEDIFGSNNRIETCDTAMKSVDDELLKKKYLTTIRIFYQSRNHPEFRLWVQ